MLRLAWIFLAYTAANAGKIPQKPTALTINCVGRPNGHYVIGCNTNFTQCHDNIAYNYICPPKLFYNALLGQCDYKNDIIECKNPKNYDGIIIKTPSDFSCKNLADGSYSHTEIPCARIYYICVHEKVVRQTCPHQQFFDAEHNRCNYKARVAACKNNKISGVLTLPDPPVAYEAVTHQMPPETAAPSTPSPVEATVIPFSKEESRPKCKTSGDGLFPDLEKECASFFWKCEHEKVFKYKCPAGLFYDIEANRCDRKEFVPNCGGVRHVTAATTSAPKGIVSYETMFEPNSDAISSISVKEVSTYSFSDAGTVAPTGTTTTTTDIPHTTIVLKESSWIDNSVSEITHAVSPPAAHPCNGLRNGPHGVSGCSQKYISCWHGITYFLQCSNGFFFHAQHKTCDHKYNIPDCLSSEKNSLLLVMKTTDVPASDVAETTVKGTEYFSGENFCFGKENGFFGSGCNQFFYSCHYGVSHILPCPRNLFYDETNHRCDYKDDACRAADPVTIPAPIVTGNATLLDESCVGKPDGWYSNGCSATYFSCFREALTPKRCADMNLRFDATRNLCDHPPAVQECREI